MTARERLSQTRGYVSMAATVAAVLWAIVGASVTEMALLVYSSVSGVVLPSRLIFLPGIAGLAAAAVTVYWVWPAGPLQRFALWVEEHDPTLAFALVTACDPTVRPSAELERAAVFDAGAVWRPVIRMLAIAAGAVLATVGVDLALSAIDGSDAMLGGRAPTAALRSAVAPEDPLAGLRVTVTPPAYSGRRATTADDPSAITALRGSRIAVSGRGSDVAAFLGEADLRVRSGRRWTVELSMPARPVALTLRHGERRRVIVLDPVGDAPPKVRLVAPPRDSILPRGAGVISVAATIEEDIGISDGYIEYMLSSGAEETFSARTVVTGRRELSGARRGNLSATINLGALGMRPGDLISIRAVARDGNTVSGRGVGVSDTRTYRVARRDEYDSLAVEAGAPIIPESTVVSQRMLILRAEALLREQAALTRDSALTRVRGIAADQIRLRERVHDIIYPAHTHAEGDVEAEGEPEDTEEGTGPVNPNLKTAYEEMWSASRELQIADAAAALPFMRAAADALDRARLASRYYLRSGTARVVVDVPRVRMQGKETGSSAARAAHPAETILRDLARDFTRAAALRDREAAANELSLIRVRALRELPEFAAALEPLIDALRRGRDPRAATAAARAELDRAAAVAREGATWSRW